MKTTKILGTVAAVCLLFAACGDDDGGGAGSNEYSEALAEMLKNEPDTPFSDDDIDCLSAELIEALGGPSALEDEGVTPEDIASSEDISELDLEVSDELAGKVANSFSDCDISPTDRILAELGDEVPDEVRECLEEKVSDDDFADLYAESLISGEEPGNDDIPPELTSAFAECISAG